jgi:hypothetical protein
MTAVAQRQFENRSGLEFADISSEEWREYTFASGATLHIEQPLQLHVSENGHRIYDGAGVSHYVPVGWIHLKWKAKDGSPNFVL